MKMFGDSKFDSWVEQYSVMFYLLFVEHRITWMLTFENLRVNTNNNNNNNIYVLQSLINYNYNKQINIMNMFTTKCICIRRWSLFCMTIVLEFDRAMRNTFPFWNILPRFFFFIQRPYSNCNINSLFFAIWIRNIVSSLLLAHLHESQLEHQSRNHCSNNTTSFIHFVSSTFRFLIFHITQNNISHKAKQRYHLKRIIGDTVVFINMAAGGWPDKEKTELKIKWSGIWGITSRFRNHRVNTKPFCSLKLTFNWFPILPLTFIFNKPCN